MARFSNRTEQQQQNKRQRQLNPTPLMIPTYFKLFVLEYNIIIGRLISLPYSSKDMDYVLG
jgi:hypothetical protein